MNDAETSRRPSRIGLYVKLVIAAGVGLYVVAFVALNASNAADVWLLPGLGQQRTSVLLVMVVTAALTSVGWWVGRQIRLVLRRRRRAG